MTALKEIESLCNKLPKDIYVYFAIYCAEDCFYLVKAEDKAVIRHCIDTTKAYMKGQAAKTELDNATSTSYASSAANAAANAAYASAAYASSASASSAAYAASAANAAIPAASAANAAVSAAYASAYSASSAASAYASKKETKLKEYLEVLRSEEHTSEL